MRLLIVRLSAEEDAGGRQVEHGEGFVEPQRGQFYPSVIYEPRVGAAVGLGREEKIVKMEGAGVVACPIFVRHAFNRKLLTLAVSQPISGRQRGLARTALPVCLPRHANNFWLHPVRPRCSLGGGWHNHGEGGRSAADAH